MEQYNLILKTALNKNFEELTEVEQLVLTLKWVKTKLQNVQQNEERAFLEALAVKVITHLEEHNIYYNK